MFTEEESLVRVELHVLDVKVSPILTQGLDLNSSFLITLLTFTKQAKFQCVHNIKGAMCCRKNAPSSGLKAPVLAK